ncbi:MAG: efflux RND transporter periplasmic adaptor subunit [Candidatus Thiodiazotropha sp.]|jgi:RND family efflux transporter MFP subunit
MITHLNFYVLIGLFTITNLYANDQLISAEAAVKREALSAFTRAHTRLVLSAESAGRIVMVNGDVGDNIKDGEPYSCLDDTYLDLELRSNRAERRIMEVDIDYFTKEVNRFSKLLKKNSSTRSQLDSAQRNLDKTKAQHGALVIAADILKERKDRLCINAPTGWRVMKRYVEPGKWVNAGMPVVEVGDFSRLVAPFALSTTEYNALLDKQEAGLKVSLPELNLVLPARLIRVSPAFDEQSRKIHLELELSEGLTVHRGGVRVSMELDIPMQTGAVLVPAHALQQRYEQYWLKRPDGSEVSVVYLGRSKHPDNGWVSVVSPDIKPGDQFIISQK